MIYFGITSEGYNVFDCIFTTFIFSFQIKTNMLSVVKSENAFFRILKSEVYK